MKNFFIDFETLGTADNSVLLSVGCLCIPEGVSLKDKNIIDVANEFGFHVKLDRKEQLEKGRVVDKNTIKWWQEQGDAAKEVLNNDNLLTCDEFIFKFNEFLKNNKYNKWKDIFWSRGLIDGRWLESYMKTIENISSPIHYASFRDTRTAIHFLSGHPSYDLKQHNIKGFDDIILHNALHDCCLDAYRLELLMTD